MPDNLREPDPFQSGEPIRASALNNLARGVAKRLRGAIGRESATSSSSQTKGQTLRERIWVLNTRDDIDVFSIFAVKRSSTLDYVPIPPIENEAFTHEYGFQYVTNYDQFLAKGDSQNCQLVSDFPVLVRYDEQKGEPKIGHPIGPKLDGKVDIAHAGFVVIAEPDTIEKRVWIVKSNAHQVRIRMITSSTAGGASEGIVVGADACSQEGPDDPDLVEPNEPFVLREILNLTGVFIPAGEIRYAKPVLGLGYCITSDYEPIYKVRSLGCFQPGGKGFFQLMTLDPATGFFNAAPSAPVEIQDEFYKFMLIPGETADVKIFTDTCGVARFKLIGSYGLTRQAQLVTDLECFAVGNVIVLSHSEVSGGGGIACTTQSVWEFHNKVWEEVTPCPYGCKSTINPNGGGVIEGASEGATVSFPCVADTQGAGGCAPVQACQITACNGTPKVITNLPPEKQTQAKAEEGRRTLYKDEVVTMVFLERIWKILPQPHETEWIAVLSSPLCPGQEKVDVTLDQTLEYCDGPRIIGDGKPVFSVDNIFGLAGLSNKKVLLGEYLNDEGEITPFIKQVQHQCRTIVVAPVLQVGGTGGKCEGEKFLEVDEQGCSIKGHVLQSTAVQSCVEDHSTFEQIALDSATAVSSLSVEKDGCHLDFYANLTTFCAIKSTFGSAALIERFTFDTVDVMVDGRVSDETTESSGAGADCKILMDKKSICVIDPGASVTTSTLAAMSPVVVMTDQQPDDDGCPVNSLITLWVLCSEDAITDSPFDCIDCEDL